MWERLRGRVTDPLRADGSNYDSPLPAKKLAALDHVLACGATVPLREKGEQVTIEHSYPVVQGHIRSIPMIRCPIQRSEINHLIT